jgi:hypothetical protein
MECFHSAFSNCESTAVPKSCETVEMVEPFEKGLTLDDCTRLNTVFAAREIDRFLTSDTFTSNKFGPLNLLRHVYRNLELLVF